MFDLRFINVAADDTYCMVAAKATRDLLAAECPPMALADIRFDAINVGLRG
jgi:hypothetical protein